MFMFLQFTEFIKIIIYNFTVIKPIYQTLYSNFNLNEQRQKQHFS